MRGIEIVTKIFSSRALFGIALQLENQESHPIVDRIPSIFDPGSRLMVEFLTGSHEAENSYQRSRRYRFADSAALVVVWKTVAVRRKSSDVSWRAVPKSWRLPLLLTAETIESWTVFWKLRLLRQMLERGAQKDQLRKSLV